MRTLLIFVTVIVLLAVAGAVVIGIKSFDGKVTEHPYETGLKWDEMVAEKSNLGWRVNIVNPYFVTGRNELSVSVKDRDGIPLKGAKISLRAGRQSTSEYDKKLDTKQRGGGYFTGYINFPLYGFWEIHVQVVKGERSVNFTKRIYVEKEGVQ